MSYTQAQADALRAAIARGAIEYQFNGERVRFPSLAEMRRQLKIMEDDLIGGGSGAMTVSYPKTLRGL